MHFSAEGRLWVLSPVISVWLSHSLTCFKTNLKNEESGQSYTWHIHNNTCRHSETRVHTTQRGNNTRELGSHRVTRFLKLQPSFSPSLPVSGYVHINTHETLRSSTDSTFLPCYCRAAVKNNWLVNPWPLCLLLSHCSADLLTWLTALVCS